MGKIESPALLVDIEKGEIWLSKAPHRLTPAERRVLTELKRWEGRPVPLHILAAELDRDPAGDGSGNPRYHILNLRRKLGHSTERPIIQTTNGGGYYLVSGALRFAPVIPANKKQTDS
jgi:DNA-binding response OmpR family regulator